ncbi:helix-turn-helix domain-containing protein [Paenibacillus oleatilyticus]|uniref:helix-turn-helix domain-containing protein n=1 Tax=Paenibacillus oleatilyticus TaxID=2594886 RepID=UPI001C1F7914|nr:helix-turn-helix transcriptional regulator [Paenibacillus oleatilyticus]MBU7319161.1 helix-turn-helix domain-containing protein [Paenibacillus oleatilyticus]
MFNKESFSARLLELRNERKIMAKDLAEHLGITKQAMSSLEKGKNIPSVPTLVALADYFEVSLDYLVGRSNNRTLL